MLTDSQLKQFMDYGFLAVEDVIDESTLHSVREEYSDLLDKLYKDWHARGLVEKPPKGLSFWEKLGQCCKSDLDWFQPLDISLPHHDIRLDTPMHFGPAVFNLIVNQNILDIVEQLLGPEITSNPIQHTRIKPPARVLPKTESRAHVTSTDWHQDMGVTMPEADNTRMVTVWIAMTDATVENGCLQVFPGKHGEMLPHCTKSQVAIADPFISKGEAVPVPLRSGGIIIIHPLTPHASLPNSSSEFRWSFDLRYNETGQPTGRGQFPEFVARSRSDPASELRDWKKWLEDWRETRTFLAEATHIPQHRWSSDAPYCA